MPYCNSIEYLAGSKIKWEHLIQRLYEEAYKIFLNRIVIVHLIYQCKFSLKTIEYNS